MADVNLITKPIQPEELNINVRSNKDTSKTINPDGKPAIKVAAKIGVSEISSFKKGNTGKIDNRPKNPKINDITINTELYAIDRVFCCFIFLCPLTYTKY